MWFVPAVSPGNGPEKAPALSQRVWAVLFVGTVDSGVGLQQC